MQKQALTINIDFRSIFFAKNVNGVMHKTTTLDKMSPYTLFHHVHTLGQIFTLLDHEAREHRSQVLFSLCVMNAFCFHFFAFSNPHCTLGHLPQPVLSSSLCYLEPTSGELTIVCQ